MNSESSPREVVVCPNCKSELVVRFCANCGQSDKNYDRSFWRVCGDFLREQFDVHSRISRTLQTLFLQPGGLANDFKQNKRASYVAPIRMYLFSSLLFFFLAAVSAPSSEQHVIPIEFDIDEDEQELGVDNSEELLGRLFELTDAKTHQLAREILVRPKDSQSRQLLILYFTPLVEEEEQFEIYVFLMPIVVKVLYDYGQLVEDMRENQAIVMVILLPWLLLTSALFHIGSRIRMVHQLVFCMHIFTVAFMFLAVETLVVKVLLGGWNQAGWISAIIILAVLIHTYLAYHNFYKDSHVVGVFKFLGLLILYGIAWCISFLAILAYTIYYL